MSTERIEELEKQLGSGGRDVETYPDVDNIDWLKKLLIWMLIAIRY